MRRHRANATRHPNPDLCLITIAAERSTRVRHLQSQQRAVQTLEHKGLVYPGLPARAPRNAPIWSDGHAFTAAARDDWPAFCSDCVRDIDPDAPSLHDNGVVSTLERLGLADIDHKPLDPVTGTRPKNLSLFGGLFDLGSPQEPGAGTAETWWLPDRLFGFWDMSDFYLTHDQLFDRDRTLSDLPAIIGAEVDSFIAGMSKPSQFLDPARWVFQGIYSAATTTASLGFATFDTVSNLVGSLFG